MSGYRSWEDVREARLSQMTPEERDRHERAVEALHREHERMQADYADRSRRAVELARRMLEPGSIFTFAAYRDAGDLARMVLDLLGEDADQASGGAAAEDAGLLERLAAFVDEFEARFGVITDEDIAASNRRLRRDANVVRSRRDGDRAPLHADGLLEGPPGPQGGNA